MARPPKLTVDYFPHDTDASEGRTLTILQSKYGNDGYAFWFKLLQILGKTSGHSYDYNKLADLEFLCAKTHQKDTETILNILETLSNLGALDHELYEHKIIWSQNFVDRVADAYGRTIGGIPQKPVIVDKKAEKPAETKHINADNPKNDTETPQTKLKESKGKERKVNKGDGFILPDWINNNTWNDFLEVRKNLKATPTLKAKQLLVKDLENYKAAGDDPNEVINQSIKNSWKGLFPLKDGRKDGIHKNNPLKSEEYTPSPPFRE